MRELVEIREAGVILEVISEWGPPGPCENCVGSQGFRSKTAFCRIKSRFNEVSLLVKYFICNKKKNFY